MSEWHTRAILTDYGMAYLVAEDARALEAVVKFLQDAGVEQLEVKPEQQN